MGSFCFSFILIIFSFLSHIVCVDKYVSLFCLSSSLYFGNGVQNYSQTNKERQSVRESGNGEGRQRTKEREQREREGEKDRDGVGRKEREEKREEGKKQKLM